MSVEPWRYKWESKSEFVHLDGHLAERMLDEVKPSSDAKEIDFEGVCIEYREKIEVTDPAELERRRKEYLENQGQTNLLGDR